MTAISRIGVHSSIIGYAPEEQIDELSGVGAELTAVDDDPGALAACDAVVTLEHRDAFFEAGLAWVHLQSAGVDHVPVDHYEEHDVVLTNSSGIHGDCIAEDVVCFVVALAHELPRFHRDQIEHRWRPGIAWQERFVVRGERACVVGLGAIGSTVAATLDAVGLEVVGVRRTPEPVPGVSEVYTNESLHEAITDARFVVLALPLTDETRHVIAGPELEAMRDDAYLVNVARGGLVDQEALVDALHGGTLAGAALDVFETEPLPEDSPLWDMENVLLTPHVTGRFDSYAGRVADLVRECLTAIESGESIPNRIA